MKLYDYQSEAARFLYNKGFGALFAGVGTGKTAVLLHVIKRLLRYEANTALVVAPLAVVKAVWEEEAKKWPKTRNLRFSRVVGSPTHRLAALRKKADIYLLNYENLPWFLNLNNLKLPDILILDESTCIKNPASLRFRGRGKVKAQGKVKAKKPMRGLKHTAQLFKFRYICTGTPKPGEYENLWSQMYVLDFGRRLQDNITSFRGVHYHQYGPLPYQRELKRGHDKIIENNIKDICYHVSEDQVKQALPTVVRRDYLIDLPPKIRQMYDEFEADKIIELDTGEVVEAKIAAAELNVLRQIAQGAVYTEDHSVVQLHSEKIQMLDAIVEDLGSRNAIVTYAYRHDLEKMLAWRDAPVLHSGLNAREYKRVINAWNAGELSLLYGFPGSMGHGLNLQGGGYNIIMFGLNWGLERYQQVIGRLRRTGQTADRVFVHRILARDTVETDLVAPRLRKASESQREFLAALRAYRERVLQRNHIFTRRS